MSRSAVEYYNRKFGDSLDKAFLHLVREVGELARGLERDNREMISLEITEIAALTQFLADKVGLNLTENIEAIYKRKLEGEKP